MGADRFKQLERRLRDLGVTYYLLETWGTGAVQYRFHCKVSVAGNPNHTRPFDATDDDPIRAMQQVVDQVEKWRTGTRP